jgi:hypothetical protein
LKDPVELVFGNEAFPAHQNPDFSFFGSGKNNGALHFVLGAGGFIGDNGPKILEVFL